MVTGLTPSQVKAKLDANEDFVLLDVRSQKEWDGWHIEAPQIRLMPQNTIFERANELPRDKEIVVTCRSGGRSYQAARILKGLGFQNIKIAEGNLLAWPYEAFGGEKD